MRSVARVLSKFDVQRCGATALHGYRATERRLGCEHRKNMALTESLPLAVASTTYWDKSGLCSAPLRDSWTGLPLRLLPAVDRPPSWPFAGCNLHRPAASPATSPEEA